MENFLTPLLVPLEVVVPKLPNTILTLVIGFLAVRFLQWLFGFALRATHATKPMQDILQATVGVVLWIGVIALIFQSLGLNQIAIALSGSVAVIGLGIATGANKLVSDILAGLFLAKSRDFKIGQIIKIAEVEGRIHSLDSRKVRILGDDNMLYIIPNTKFDEQVWHIFPSKEAEKGSSRA
jgi:small-conductance mechanosensitive channel